jgi:hypothetical protein
MGVDLAGLFARRLRPVMEYSDISSPLILANIPGRSHLWLAVGGGNRSDNVRRFTIINFFYWFGLACIDFRLHWMAYNAISHS